MRHREPVDLKKYPPTHWVCVFHPDVQLAPEEWLELEQYEKLESDALASPGVLGFLPKPDNKVIIPLRRGG